MANALTAPQKVRYDTLKKIVRDNIGASRKLWGALKAIKDEKLYLHEYDTWEKFCNDQYDLSARHADRMIGALEVSETLQIPSKVVDRVRPTGSDLNERQLRELAKVPAEQRAEIIKAASAGGKTTAKRIADAAAPPVSAEKPEARKDGIGRTIPAEILAEWNRAATVATRLRSCASEIKVTVERGLADKDIIFREMQNPIVAEAAGLHYSLSQIMPYAVCPQCQGRALKNCHLCRERGWISKFRFDSPAVESEVKAILKMTAK